MHDIPMTAKSELDVQANRQASSIILARSARIVGRDLLTPTALPRQHTTIIRMLARSAERTIDAFVLRATGERLAAAQQGNALLCATGRKNYAQFCAGRQGHVAPAQRR